MSNWLDIKNVWPLIEKQQVIVETNWRKYFARLMPSDFGGVEFRVFNTEKSVQLTTVIGWKEVCCVSSNNEYKAGYRDAINRSAYPRENSVSEVYYSGFMDGVTHR